MDAPAQISEKIVSVKLHDTKPKDTAVVHSLNEKMKRPTTLRGQTTKLKTPLSTSSLFITMSYIVLNEGTEFETCQPFEIFINSKEMENFQWIVALTLLISAIFRKGGDIVFVVEELKSVFDPRGGYLSKQGRVPSLVAEIGMVIEEQLKSIGVIKHDDSLVRAIEEKKAQHIASGGSLAGTTCPQCGSPTLVRMEGCPTCLSCGYSKCS